MLLLGVPLAVAGVVLQGEQARTSVQQRADAVLAAADARVAEGAGVDDALLGRYTGEGGPWPAHVRVEVGDGTAVEAGPAVAGAAVTGTAASAEGLAVTVSTPRGYLVGADVRLVVLVLALAAGAVAAGSAVGLVAARRLSRPLEQLAERAEALGSGRVPAAVAPSGVEEVDSVAAALARSAERLARRLADERRFAVDASHQLRTPLAAVSLRLEEVVATTTEPAVAEEARTALGQVERLVGVVDDLLARTAAAPSRASVPVALATVLAQQREEWRPTYERAGRVLDVGEDAGVRVLASAGPLAQVLAVLLENSLVHGGGTTSVRVRVGAEWVVVEVGDEGPGVPAVVGARVFEPRVSGGGSTGLGLALARDLAVAEGGRLELQRERPAVFALFLPAA